LLPRDQQKAPTYWAGDGDSRPGPGITPRERRSANVCSVAVPRCAPERAGGDLVLPAAPALFGLPVRPARAAGGHRGRRRPFFDVVSDGPATVPIGRSLSTAGRSGNASAALRCGPFATGPARSRTVAGRTLGCCARRSRGLTCRPLPRRRRAGAAPATSRPTIQPVSRSTWPPRLTPTGLASNRSARAGPRPARLRSQRATGRAG
jgi:hypothetical protein